MSGNGPPLPAWHHVGSRGWLGWDRSCIIHFTDVKTEAQRGKRIHPSLHCLPGAWILDQALKGPESILSFSLIEIQSIYNVVLVSGVQYTEFLHV